MRLSLSKRLVSLLTLLLFATGVSYYHLCAAQVIKCPPCQSEVEHDTDEAGGCKACGQSAGLARTVQPSKSVDVPVAFVLLFTDFVEKLILSTPERSVVGAEVPSTEIPIASILRDIKQSTPIRGPSIVV